jgi:hypothetical protein
MPIWAAIDRSQRGKSKKRRHGPWEREIEERGYCTSKQATGTK